VVFLAISVLYFAMNDGGVKNAAIVAIDIHVLF
jgi:hypothetical protein